MDTPITRAEHEEFAKRMEEENHRQNKRLDVVEQSVKNVESLAINMKIMLDKMDDHGKRIDKLEGEDGEKWRTVTTYALSTVIGLLIGYIFKTLGM